MVVPVPHAKPEMTDDMKEGSLCWTTVTGTGVGELADEEDFTGEEDFAGEEDLAGEENLAGEDDLTGEADLTGDLLRGIFLIYTPTFYVEADNSANSSAGSAECSIRPARRVISTI